MYKIKEYVFDSDRFILYKSNLDNKIINELESTFKSNEERYMSIYSSLLKIDSNHMCMNKVEIDHFGIMLTYKCNLRCQYCAYSSTGYSDYKLTFNDIILFVDDAIKKRTVKKLVTKNNIPMRIEFTGGGEPTFEWDLFVDAVNYIECECNKKNIPYILKLTTNGMLSDNQISFIGRHFAEIMISYDGLPDIHNKNRASLSLKETSSIVIHSIQELSQLNIKVTVRTTVWQKDFNKIKEMYEFMCSAIPNSGRILWSIYPTQPYGRAVEPMKNQNNTELKSFIYDYVDIVLENNAKYEFNNIIDITLPIFIDRTCDIFCGAPSIVSPWLLPDKTITTCVESPSGRVNIGEIKDGKLYYYNDYSDMFLKVTQEKHKECRNCICYNYCMGGCPMWHLRSSVGGREPQECSLQKEFLKYIIEASLKGEYSFNWKLEEIKLPSGQEGIYKLINGGI